MCCGNLVDVVEVFPYLGSRVTSDGSSLIEIDRRLGVAWGVVGSLKRVWRSRYLSRRTKVEVFKRLVLPSLLYGCETWTLTAKLRARLDSFGTINLRRILGYKWFDFVPNKSVLQMTSMKTISGMVAERQLSMSRCKAFQRGSCSQDHLLFRPFWVEEKAGKTPSHVAEADG